MSIEEILSRYGFTIIKEKEKTDLFIGTNAFIRITPNNILFKGSEFGNVYSFCNQEFRKISWNTYYNRKEQVLSLDSKHLNPNIKIPFNIEQKESEEERNERFNEIIKIDDYSKISLELSSLHVFIYQEMDRLSSKTKQGVVY